MTFFVLNCIVVWLEKTVIFASGINAIIADHFKVLVWNVSNKQANEIHDR